MKLLLIIICLFSSVSFATIQEPIRPSNSKATKEKAKEMTERLKKRLSLTNEQSKKIELINMAAEKKMSAIHSTNQAAKTEQRHAHKKINFEREKAIKNELTNQQKIAFEKLLEERRARQDLPK